MALLMWIASLVWGMFAAALRPSEVGYCEGDEGGGDGGNGDATGDGDDSGNDDAGGDGDDALAEKFGAEAAAEIRRLRRENATHRTKLRDAEAKIGEYEERDLTDAQKAQKEIERLREGQERARKRLIRAEVKAQAAAIGIVDDDAAYRLLDLDGIEVGDDDEVAGVKEALEALATARPWLKAAQQQQQRGGGADMSGNGGEPPPRNMEQELRAAFGR